MTTIGDDDACPCGSGSRYGGCCGRLHDGFAAETAEALMRSRYSAYAVGLIDYLLATWHASSAPGDLELPPVKWLGLEVRRSEQAGDAGVVEFVARCKVNGRAQRMHEISNFVRQDGRWYYIDGQVLEED